MSAIAGTLPRFFKNFPNLERKSIMHEEEETKRDHHEQDVCPNVFPERREVPETDTPQQKF